MYTRNYVQVQTPLLTLLLSLSLNLAGLLLPSVVCLYRKQAHQEVAPTERERTCADLTQQTVRCCHVIQTHFQMPVPWLRIFILRSVYWKVKTTPPSGRHESSCFIEFYTVSLSHLHTHLRMYIYMYKQCELNQRRGKMWTSVAL